MLKLNILEKGKKYYLTLFLNWFILTFYHKPRNIIDLCFHYRKYCSCQSYYLDKKSKKQINIFLDQLSSILRFSKVNDFYFPYGFDVKRSAEMDKYLHYSEFMQVRDRLNLRNKHSATFLLRNKFYFGIFADTYGVNSGKNIALISNTECYDIQRRKITSLDLILNSLSSGEYFVKLVGGECGCGIFLLRKETSLIFINDEISDVSRVRKLISSGQFLIQGRIQQHPHLSALHGNSLNSIRLITIKNVRTGEVSLFPSILRIGTNGNIVDNTSQGGLAVGINMQTGRLCKYGFYKPQFGTKVSKHPNSGIEFQGYQIPYFDEIKKQAILLHRMLPDVYSIGWDIAIGTNGPIFIEGNDNWEINGPQICHGGLKKVFYEMLDM